MSTYDEIFPAKRNPRLVQTEWASGWGGVVAGYRYVAAFVTENSRRFVATIDQAGLAVFYMQRHCVELMLKLTIEGAGGSLEGTHRISVLWDRCRAQLQPHDPAQWAQFENKHRGLIKALVQVDDGSENFRYPVDRKGTELDRPDFIDLQALNQYVEDLYYGLQGWLDWLAERSP